MAYLFMTFLSIHFFVPDVQGRDSFFVINDYCNVYFFTVLIGFDKDR